MALQESSEGRWGPSVFLPVVASICVLACSHDPPPTPPSVGPELEALYVMIRDHREQYERGVQRIVDGQPVAGREIVRAATERLSVAAELCGRTPGCDGSLFAESMAQVAERQLNPDPAPDSIPAPEPVVPQSEDAPAPPPRFDETALMRSIPLNTEVLAALNDWLTWNRPALIETIENYRYLRPSIAPIYEEAGLPEPLLFAMLAKETGAKVHAYSRAGAVGPLQFMPATARRYGIRPVRDFDTRLDPVLATRANVRFMADQLERFDGNLELALAAYNGGETRVRKLHGRLGGASFWDPRLHYSLPTETREYVPQILAAALLFEDPASFGVEFDELDQATTTIELVDEISIGELTICLGHEGNPRGWFRTLRNLNPRLKPAVRSKAGELLNLPLELVEPYVERCVGDSSFGELARRLHDADFPARPSVIRYTVRSGDTLARIAGRHGCKSVRDLAAINGIEPPEYVIHVGQSLSVPACP